MRVEIQTLTDEISKALNLLKKHVGWADAKDRLEDFNRQAESSNLWDDPKSAQILMRQRQELEDAINNIKNISTILEDNIGLIELGEEENDEQIILEAEAALKELSIKTSRMQVETLLCGEADANDCYLEVHSGAGGTESQDWASMLLRMYTRWAERNKMKVENIEVHYGEEAGIKSVTILIKGHNAYGWLKTESGVHRLVRISPFDSQSKRHTSFSSVWVYPVVDETIEIDVSESDVRIDTYRASGAGGQHVNTTDSAVRITHLATGIVVQCQNDRSQHKNKASAWAMLRARLYEAELQKREEEAMEQASSKTEIGWGHQIRSYVLQPYQLVKDLRTSVESTSPSDVLDGDLDRFMQGALALRVGANHEK